MPKLAFQVQNHLPNNPMSHNISHFFGSFLAGTGLMALLPAAALAASFPTLTPPPSTPVVAPTPDLAVLLQVKPAVSAYRTFSYNGYSFEIPRKWKAEKKAADFSDGNKVNAEVVFKDADGKQAARLICPPMPLGLEGMDTQGWSRKTVKNNFLYEFNLVLGKPEGQKATTFAFVSMVHVGYESNEWYTDPGYGCELTLDTVADLDATAKRIYRSVKVESWKTAGAGGLAFRYPAAWAMKTADVAADWKHKDFTDVNGRTVAEMDCPIPARGLEGFAGPTFGRAITKNGGRFEAEWEPLKSTDDPAGETHYLQHLTWTRSGPAIQSRGATEDSCVLYSPQPGQTGIFREIYKSLK